MKVVIKPIVREGENECFHCGRKFSRSNHLKAHVHGETRTDEHGSEYFDTKPCEKKAAIFEVEKILQIYVNPIDGETEGLIQWKRSLIPASALSNGGQLIEDHGCEDLIEWWRDFKGDDTQISGKGVNSRRPLKKSIGHIQVNDADDDNNDDDDHQSDDNDDDTPKEDGINDSGSDWDIASESEVDDDLNDESVVIDLEERRFQRLVNKVKDHIQKLEIMELNEQFEEICQDLKGKSCQELDDGHLKSLHLMKKSDSRKVREIVTRITTNYAWKFECSRCHQRFKLVQNRNKHENRCEGSNVTWEEFDVFQILQTWKDTTTNEMFLLVDWCPSHVHLCDMSCPRLLADYVAEVDVDHVNGFVGMKQFKELDVKNESWQQLLGATLYSNIIRKSIVNPTNLELLHTTPDDEIKNLVIDPNQVVKQRKVRKQR